MRGGTSERKKKTKRRIACLLVSIIIAGSVFAYFDKVAMPLVKELAEADVHAKTVSAYIKANARIKTFSEFYGEFFEYENNSDGEITLIKANSANINSIAVYAQQAMQESINELDDYKVELPSGAFTGLALMADKGTPVSINIAPVGAVNIAMGSYFYTEGINQTIHRLVMRVQTTVRMLVPVRAEDVSVSMDFILAEQIIVGRIPDSYITGISDDNIFDLMP